MQVRLHEMPSDRLVVVDAAQNVAAEHGGALDSSATLH
jgi:hypothetical protein